MENDLATSALASSQATETMRERIRNAQVKELESFLGNYPREDIDRNFSNSLPELALAPFPPTPAQAMENRPDLQAAKLQLEASGYDLSAAKMSLLPTISLSGGPGSRSEEFGDLLDNRFEWGYPGNTQPLFNMNGSGQIFVDGSSKLPRQTTEQLLFGIYRGGNSVANESFCKKKRISAESPCRSRSQNNRSLPAWSKFLTLIPASSFEAESRLLSTRKMHLKLTYF